MNYAFNNRFQVQFSALPNVAFSLTEFTSPGLTLNTAEVQIPKFNVSLPGEVIDPDTFSMTFMVDESYENYKSVYNWLKEFQAGKDPYSDVRIFGVDSSGNKIAFILVAEDCIPQSLTGINFNTQSQSDPITATITVRSNNIVIR